MNAYKVETVLSEDGALILKDLPFHMGDVVEVIILERLPDPTLKAMTEQPEASLYPLRGKVLHYEDPFEAAILIEDWEVLK